MRDSCLSLLGLCAKAGKTVSGQFSVEKAVKSQEAKVVIVAGDASDNTKKHFSDICSYRKIPVYVYKDGKSLGACIGKDFRMVMAVTDEGLAINLESKLREVLN